MNVSIQWELTSGVFLHDNAAALTTKSFNEIFKLSLVNCSFKSFLTLLPIKEILIKQSKVFIRLIFTLISCRFQSQYSSNNVVLFVLIAINV